MSCAEVGKLLALVGLAGDILGAVLIWRFGLPEQVSRHGGVLLLTEQADPVEIRKADRYDLLSRTGLGLLVAGFALQFIGNALQM